MLATVLLPDAGEAWVLGHSTTAEPAAVTGRIGYMSQRFSMYPDLSVAENLDFFATVRGVPKQTRRERSAALLEGMGLAEFRARQARHLSGGMKQKLMLATTLMPVSYTHLDVYKRQRQGTVHLDQDRRDPRVVGAAQTAAVQPPRAHCLGRRPPDDLSPFSNSGSCHRSD